METLVTDQSPGVRRPKVNRGNADKQQLSMATAVSLKAELGLLEKRISELESQAKLDSKHGNCSEPEEVKAGESEQIRRLTNLLAQETQRRIQAEKELERANDLLNECGDRMRAADANILTNRHVHQCVFILEEKWEEYKKYSEELFRYEDQDILESVAKLRERVKRRNKFRDNDKMIKMIRKMHSDNKKSQNLEANSDSVVDFKQPAGAQVKEDGTAVAPHNKGRMADRSGVLDPEIKVESPDNLGEEWPPFSFKFEPSLLEVDEFKGMFGDSD